MNDVACVVRLLCIHGEDVRVLCDYDGWSVEHNGVVVFRSQDGREVMAFCGGLASYHMAI